jgi:putative ATP-dependent endonuclease of OLD family
MTHAHTRHEMCLCPVKSPAFDHDKLRRTSLTFLAVEEPENSLSPFFLSRIVA